MALFSQDNNMPTSVLGLAQGLAGNVQRYAGEPLLSSMGMESEIKQITNVIDEVDPSNKQSIMEGFRKVMEINPAYAEEYKKQMLDFADQFAETEDMDAKAAAFAAGYQLPDPTKVSMEEYWDAKNEMRDKMRIAGYSDTNAFRSLNSELTGLGSEIARQKAEARKVGELKARTITTPDVMKNTVFSTINSENFFGWKDKTTDELNEIAESIGANFSATEKRLQVDDTKINPSEALPYFNRLLQVKDIYKFPADLNDRLAGIKTQFNKPEYDKWSDKMFGFGGSTVDATKMETIKLDNGNTQQIPIEFLKFLKYNLIIPGQKGTKVTYKDAETGEIKTSVFSTSTILEKQKQFEPLFKYID